MGQYATRAVLSVVTGTFYGDMNEVYHILNDMTGSVVTTREASEAMRLCQPVAEKNAQSWMKVGNAATEEEIDKLVEDHGEKADLSGTVDAEKWQAALKKLNETESKRPFTLPHRKYVPED